VFTCICRAVTDDRVNAAIDKGATTIEAVADATGAGTGCGSCQARIGDLIGERSHACPLVSAGIA
jgi:bacterioferritin-associated ferredoxin